MPVILPVAERQTGSFISQSVVVPASDRIWLVTIIGISDSDWENPALSIEMRVERQVGAEWMLESGCLWRGQVGGYTGKGGEVNPDPYHTVGLENLVGVLVRAVLNVEGPVTFGIDAVRVA